MRRTEYLIRPQGDIFFGLATQKGNGKKLYWQIPPKAAAIIQRGKEGERGREGGREGGREAMGREERRKERERKAGKD